MIVEEIKDIKSGKKELRQFGITVGIVLGLLGGLFLWRGKDCYFCFFILSAVLLSLGIVAPILLKPIHKVWMSLAILIGWFVTRVILIVLFYLVVTPIGFLARLFGKDFLNQRIECKRPSYWIKREEVPFDKSRYEQLF